jgi:hypothetical protein
MQAGTGNYPAPVALSCKLIIAGLQFVVGVVP